MGRISQEDRRAIQRLLDLRAVLVEAAYERAAAWGEDLAEPFMLIDYGGDAGLGELPEDAVAEVEAATGTRFIGQGLTRAVWRLPSGRVVKIAFDKLGRLANQREYFIWESSNPKARQVLVPVRDFGADYVVMDYAHQDPSQEIGPALLRQLRKLGLPTEDDNSTNWGVHRGRWKLLDYGH